jgi:4-hydroxy-tetrahydrodipicolinate synthase
MPVSFSGLGIALITLFDDRREVQAEQTADHAARLVELGGEFVVVCGTIGEGSTLSPSECASLIRAARDRLPNSVPVIAVTRGNTSEEASARTAEALSAGADAILALSPPGSMNLPGYYRAVSAAAQELPVLAYHCPPASSPGIPLEVLHELPVEGIKDSSRNAKRIVAEIEWGKSVFVGSTTMLEIAFEHRAAGAILGIANVEPSCAETLLTAMQKHEPQFLRQAERREAPRAA